MYPDIRAVSRQQILYIWTPPPSSGVQTRCTVLVSRVRIRSSLQEHLYCLNSTSSASNVERCGPYTAAFLVNVPCALFRFFADPFLVK